MIKKFLENYFEIGVVGLLFVISWLFSFTVLNNYITLYNVEKMYIPYENIIDNSTLNISISTLDQNKETISGEVQVNKNDYYTLSDGKKSFLISDTKNSYNYGFITREKVGNISYLFSHNSYKYTENSGYYIYNNWKEWDIITFNNKDKYIIKSTKLYDFNKTDYSKEKTDINIRIIYFTCTPYWDNIRKAYFLENFL